MSGKPELGNSADQAADKCSQSSQGQGASQGFSWRILLGTIRRTFPRAKQLKTSSLCEWLEDEERRKKLLLLDVREAEEYVVSTLEGALHVKPDGTDVGKIIDKISEIKAALKDSVDVVCYCSVGYRSSKLAQIIQDRLKTEFDDGTNVSVYNLEGSLFKWANEKRPMVDKQGNRTVFCHPYSSVWGTFLDHNLRKWTSECGK